MLSEGQNFYVLTGGLTWREAVVFVKRGLSWGDVFGRSIEPALLIAERIRVMGGSNFDAAAIFETAKVSAVHRTWIGNCRHSDGYPLESQDFDPAEKPLDASLVKVHLVFVNPLNDAAIKNAFNLNWDNPKAVWVFGNESPYPKANVESYAAVGYKDGKEPDPVKAYIKAQNSAKAKAEGSKNKDKTLENPL